MRKVFLENLPRTKKGIDWNNCIGIDVKFIYDDIKGKIKIMNFIKNKQRLIIKYEDVEFNMYSTHFMHCNLGKLINKLNNKNNNKFEIGAYIKNDKRDMIITDMKYVSGKDLYFKYKCNKCGFDCGRHYLLRNKEYKDEHWMSKSSLEQGHGCVCCCGYPQIVVQGINDIATTDTWMVKYFKDKNEAYKNTKSSKSKIIAICPDCGNEREIRITKLYNYHTISCTCGDKKSFPEKIMFYILRYLNTILVTEYSPKWTGKKRYDFYFEINDEKYIVETHGKQHYEDSNWGKTSDVQANDKLKKELALNNGIKEENYIVIDCRYSNIEYIKQNILTSKLNEIFDLSVIDWIEVEKFALSNLVKVVCDYKRNNPNKKIKDIANIMKYSISTIRNWLNKGKEFGWV